jgi:lysozyme family protein
MADFMTAFLETKGVEGKYSNHPRDTGGETVWGIARLKVADWVFWPRWDSFKAELGLEAACDHPETLAAVQSWYETSANGPWVKIRGPEIQSQWIANELFDTATNAYHLTAAEFLQRTLNALNRSDMATGPMWEELEVRGGIGPRTLGALREAMARGLGPVIFTYLNCLQGAFYIRLAEIRPENEAFVKGWARRISNRNLSDFA